MAIGTILLYEWIRLVDEFYRLSDF
jgi:hypothetical protein